MKWTTLLPDHPIPTKGLWDALNAPKPEGANTEVLQKWAFDSAEALKDLFIFVMGIIFIAGVLYVLSQTFLSWWRQRRPYIQELSGGGALERVMTSKLPFLRDLRHHLVDIPTDDGSGQYQKKRTVDASDIMPESALAPSFISNRLILAIPSVLTGMGVLGTFMGLALGMREIHLNGDADKLVQDIAPLIDAFAVAFSCSVWGLTASLLFSGIEKAAEAYSLSSLSWVHSQIDDMFPRYVPEEALLEMARSGLGSENLLKGLAVAIGEQMQVAIGRLGAEIKEAVATATAEGQGPLAAQAADMLSTALTAELLNLKKQIEKMGEMFSQTFSGASENLMQSIQSFQPSIEALSTTVSDAQRTVVIAVEKLNSHESVMKEMADAASNIQGAATSFGSMKESMETSALKNQEAAKAQSDASQANQRVAGEFQKIGEGLVEIKGTINEGAKVIGSLGGPIKELQALLESQPDLQRQIDSDRQTSEEKRNERILAMSAGLAEKVGEAAAQFAQVGQLAEQLASAAESLDDASSKLSEFGDQVSEASNDQLKASEMSRNAALASEKTAKALEPIPDSIEALSAGLVSAGESVRDGAEAAKESYAELINLQRQWFDGADKGLKIMKESLQQVFDTYGQQVQGQTGVLMKQWTEKVNECLQSYESQLSQMLGGVEEIQDAISKLKKK